MSKRAAEHHLKAAEHHEHAACHHKEAAKHHQAGSHEKQRITHTWLVHTLSTRASMLSRLQRPTPKSMATNNS